MERLSHEISHIMTWGGFLALLNIILIDIVMSWDNAIIIWMATRNLPERLRKKAIMIWIVLATVMRIWFASIAVILMSIVWLKLAWWLLLLYVVWKFYEEIRAPEWQHSQDKVKSSTGFAAAIYTIVIADISMSLDNVLAVSWAAWESLLILWIGLVFSIVLMALASNFIANKLEKYPQIQWLGLLVILFVAIWMVLEWSHEVQQWFQFSHINLIPAIIFILWTIMFVLHDKYIKALNEDKIKEWIWNKYMEIIIFTLLVIIAMAFFGDIIHSYLFSHTTVLYGFLLIIILIFVELISLWRAKKKK